MKRAVRPFFFLIAVFAPLVLPGQRPGFIPGNETYLWPTNASDLLSATFAETRSQHFHAAIDVKTWGRSGFDVYATRDAILWRISINPGGYGKMLVLKHPDGSFSLYAHLDEFETHIQNLADSIRYSKHQGELDTVFLRRTYRIKKGDLIGLSGSTGIGPAHLHFELRSPMNRPFNPLLAGLEVKDNIKPQFSQLGAEVLSPFGQIDGHPDFQIKKPLRKGSVSDFGTLKARGDIGLSAITFDQANGASNTYAVYEIQVTLDSRPIFHAKADSFGFEQTGQMFLDRVYPLLRSRNLFLQRLWIHDGNTVPFYDRSLGRGIIQDDGKKHLVEITARDFHGNTSRARVQVDFSKTLREITLRPAKPLPDRATGSLIEQSLLLNTSNWSIFKWPEDTRFLSFEMHAAGKRQQRDNALLFHSNSSDFLAQSDSRRAYFFTVVPGSSSEINLPESRLRIRFSPVSVYDTTLVGVEAFSFHGHPAFYIHPENEPTAGGIRVEYELDERTVNLKSYRMYHLSPRWKSYRGRTSTVSGSYLSAVIQDFGLHVALPDTINPSVSAPFFVRSTSGKWLLSIPASDNLSGINPKQCWVEWDGKRGFAEYEEDKSRLLFKHPELRPGRNTVFVHITDRSGNVNETTFMVR